MRFRHASSVRVLLMGLTLCVLSLSRPAQAQIGFGLIGGANFSSLNSIQANGNLVSFDNASSFHAGVFLDIQLGPLGIRPSVLYLDAGSLFQGATFLNQDDFKLSYISIPVDLLFTMGVGPLKPYLFAGPEFRLLNSTTAPIDLEENPGDVHHGCERRSWTRPEASRRWSQALPTDSL